MKLIRIGLTALLALAVGAAIPAVAQHDHDGDSKHDKDRDGKHDNGHHYGQEKHEHDGHYARYEEYGDHHRKRIPEEHFRAHFGREHRFVIVRPVIVAGHPRFQYDGYWFAFARPLPPGWRYTDNVYVDYVGENYYLYSPAHPGVRVSVNLVL